MDEKNFKMQVARSAKDVLSFYDKYAPTWDDRFKERPSTLDFHRIRLESFLKLANLKNDDCIIEIGVGTGPYLDMISPLVRKVICVDGSEQMLNVLMEKHQSLSNIELAKINLEEPLKKGEFEAELVYGFGVIEHIIETNIFLENCRNMLKPGGRIIFVTVNGKSPWYKGIRNSWRSGPHCSTDRYYTAKQLHDLMSKHSFVLEKVSYWGYFPAGINNVGHRSLKTLGNVLGKTWMKYYSGGLTVSYIDAR